MNFIYSWSLNIGVFNLLLLHNGYIHYPLYIIDLSFPLSDADIIVIKHYLVAFGSNIILY